MTVIVNNFRELLDKYKFVYPVPEDIQSFAVLNSKKGLTVILKNAGDYSFIFGKVLFILYAARKFNIKLTIARSQFLLILSSAVMLALTTASFYFLFSNFPSAPHLPEKTIENNSIIEKYKLIAPDSQQNPAIPVNYLIGVDSFTGSADAVIISEKITSELEQILGKRKVLILGKKAIDINPPKILMGSVQNLGETKYLTIKLINSSTSRIEYLISVKLKSEEETAAACADIAKNISEKL
ncbi:MAG: hypothetical protein CVV44_17215 [Spirochaetae bacterium HGW-Spirochaetae-1]|jgi:hypothetical protein|nr:MAG: hypothetical protein CVV44_17215 [Spirochaetae bacterium HGW-Spirochaetae-1]